MKSTFDDHLRLAGISTTARKLMGSFCRRRAGLTACHTISKSGRMFAQCVVHVLSESQLP